MHRPLGLHSLASVCHSSRRGERCLLHTVSELKHYAQHNSADECSNRVNGEYRPPRVQQHRDAEGEREKHDLAADEDEQVVASGPRHFMGADATSGNVVKIVKEVPFDREKSVQ